MFWLQEAVPQPRADSPGLRSAGELGWFQMGLVGADRQMAKGGRRPTVVVLGVLEELVVGQVFAGPMGPGLGAGVLGPPPPLEGRLPVAPRFDAVGRFEEPGEWPEWVLGGAGRARVLGQGVRRGTQEPSRRRLRAASSHTCLLLCERPLT